MNVDSDSAVQQKYNGAKTLLGRFYSGAQPHMLACAHNHVLVATLMPTTSLVMCTPTTSCCNAHMHPGMCTSTTELPFTAPLTTALASTPHKFPLTTHLTAASHNFPSQLSHATHSCHSQLPLTTVPCYSRLPLTTPPRNCPMPLTAASHNSPSQLLHATHSCQLCLLLGGLSACVLELQRSSCSGGLQLAGQPRRLPLPSHDLRLCGHDTLAQAVHIAIQLPASRAGWCPQAACLRYCVTPLDLADCLSGFPAADRKFDAIQCQSISMFEELIWRLINGFSGQVARWTDQRREN